MSVSLYSSPGCGIWEEEGRGQLLLLLQHYQQLISEATTSLPLRW